MFDFHIALLHQRYETELKYRTHLCFSIFDYMSLVQDAVVPLDAGEEVNIFANDIVRSND